LTLHDPFIHRLQNLRLSQLVTQQPTPSPYMST